MKTIPLQIRISEFTEKQLLKICTVTGRNKSEIVRNLIDKEYLRLEELEDEN